MKILSQNTSSPYNRVTLFQLQRLSVKKIGTLQGSTHDLTLVTIKGKTYVRKTMEMQEIWNEKAFIETLKKNQIPAINYHFHPLLKPNELLLTFIKDAHTFADNTEVYSFFQLGKLLRKIHSVSFGHCFRINEHGKEETLTWDKEIGKIIMNCDSSDLPSSMRHSIEQKLKPLTNTLPVRYTILHGQLLPKNVLSMNNSLTLLNKAPEFFSGDPLYDLASIYHMFSEWLFFNRNFQARHRQREAHKAFTEGYGSNPLQRYGEELERYMLLRAYQNYGHNKDPHAFDLMEALLKKI